MSTAGHPGGPEWEGGEGVAGEVRRAHVGLGGKDTFETPLANAIADWLQMAAKASRALRVYDRNNALIGQFMERLDAQLTAIHVELAELTLTVREDRFLFGRDAVYVNNDREEGLPFILYRNAFRRLTFVRGMNRDEQLEFLAALQTDFGSYANTGEDLVSVLWRLQLPHLRYFTIDAFAMTADAGTEAGKKQAEEVDRLQGEIDGLVARLYSNRDVSDDDLVKGVSITREDLEALKELRAEADADIDLLDVATARVIAAVSSDELAGFRELVRQQDHDVLVTRVIDTLLEILYREESSQDSSKTVELIQQLFDSLLLARRFTHARRLVQELREREITGRDLKEVHLSRLLLRLLAAESRVAQVLSSLSDSKTVASALEVQDFLRTLGPAVTNSLLAALDSLSSHAHRRMVCDLIVELGRPDPAVLLERMKRSNWAVVVDLLQVATHLSLEDLGPIVLWAIEHEHSKVRAQGIGLLRGYPPGVADELIAKALSDSDSEVREAALRFVRSRRSPLFARVIEDLVKADTLEQREEKEVRNLVMAYATLAGDAAVPLLDHLLSPGIFARSYAANTQIAAAMALGKIGSEAARQALQRGGRTLNHKVREACKRALMKPENEAEAESQLTQLTERPRPVPDANPNPDDDPLARARNPRAQPRAALIPASSTPGRALAADAALARPPPVVRGSKPHPEIIPEKTSRLSTLPPPPLPPSGSSPASARAPAPSSPGVVPSRPVAPPPPSATEPMVRGSRPAIAPLATQPVQLPVAFPTPPRGAPAPVPPPPANTAPGFSPETPPGLDFPLPPFAPNLQPPAASTRGTPPQGMAVPERQVPVIRGTPSRPPPPEAFSPLTSDLTLEPANEAPHRRSSASPLVPHLTPPSAPPALSDSLSSELGPWTLTAAGSNASWVTQVGSDPSWADKIPMAPAPGARPPPARTIPEAVTVPDFQAAPVLPGGRPVVPPPRMTPPAPAPRAPSVPASGPIEWEHPTEPGLEALVIRRAPEPPPKAPTPAPLPPTRPKEPSSFAGVYRVNPTRETLPPLRLAPEPAPPTPGAPKPKPGDRGDGKK